MGKKKPAHTDAAAKRNPNQPSVVSEVSGAQQSEPAAQPKPEPSASVADNGEVEAKMAAADEQLEQLRHENKMLKEELNNEIEAANELRLALGQQSSSLYVAAAVTAASLAAAAYLAAKLRQHQR